MKRGIISLALLIFALPLGAQEQFDFYGRGPYNADVPRPSALLGYTAGARQTQYHEQQMVFDRLLATAPDRVRAERIGVTEEGRVMRVLLISSPANIARLDEIRADIARLTDPRITSETDTRAIAARTPVVVFLSFSVHGNEPAGFESAMWVAYQLAASNEPATRMILDSVLVVINPSANPDGHERFAVWSNSVARGIDAPYALEWAEPWDIWGRFSHYRFDMNRDLIAQSQEPVRATLGAFMRWNPQVFVDLHSTTEQYFFPPFADPVNPNMTANQMRWVEMFGRGNAEAFDRYGWQYYTRDIFDGFYPGYYDMAPVLHGATGMTYETDGGKALARRRGDGTVITFRDGIAHHTVASLATLETAARHRHQRLLDFHEYFRSAVADAHTQQMKRVVILPDRDHTNAARLASLLLGHGIEVTRLTAPLTSATAHHFETPGARAQRRSFPTGALVVDLAQPRGRMTRALLEPDAKVPEEFARLQIERFERNLRRGDAPGEGYEFYDVTAWSLPLTLGLEAFWTEDAGAVTGERLALDPADRVRPLAPAGGVTGGIARSAYVFPNDRQAAAELALALLDEGFIVNASTRPLRADGRDYPRGTFVIRTQRNPEALHERIAELATERRMPVTAIQSAFPDQGAVGVGSESVRAVNQPRILVAAGPGITQTSYGALWHFLERELGYPFVPVPLANIGRMHTISDYNVLIIPSGTAATIRSQLGNGGIERLKRWVQDGGVVIAYGGATAFLTADGIELTTVKRITDNDNAKKDTLPGDPDLTPPVASPSANPNAPAPVPGAIFRATLDTSHWLTLGYERSTLPVLFSGSGMLRPSTKGANPVSFVGDDLRISGFVWPDNTERLLEGTIWAAVESHGRGHAILFAEDPLFRAFWRGTARLLTNAMMFGTGR